MKTTRSLLLASYVLNFGALALTIVVATSASAQQPNTQARPPVPAPRVPEGVKVSRDLPYVTDGHARQKLDLYIPEKADAPLPVIIWVHGGGWAAGSKDGCPPARDNYMARGYAVASIGYRLSGDAIFPAQIEDCKAAIRWLRAHAKEHNLDANRFAVWGSSAGGHLVALLGTSGDVKGFDVGPNLDQSSRVQAVCDYYGPTDLLQMDAHALNKGRAIHNAADSPESRLIGGAIQENKDKVAKANPITYVSKDDPPFLIVHGDQDPTVAHHQSELLYGALKSVGVRVRFHTIEGAGHGTGFGGPELETIVQDFFDRHLKGTQPATDEPLATESKSQAVARPGAIGGQPGAATRPAGRAGVSWDQIRTREDANSDGKVTKDEFKGPPPLFDRLDRNRDGRLTKEDF
ncbi:alpha/beta hydrolase [Humisphaera borealis]|uniref:alpha/beta hydrolase n=1 Tax=Humisphaera borealis TaxID=2807512 RepID=UPI0019D143B8|nr:alpha/beta hydrolase [Humisphaera borealis]